MLLLIALPASAQTGSITGVVTDSGTGEVIPGVNIVLSELGIGSASDAEGRYTITGVPPGSHRLEASFIGYHPYEATVTVRADEPLRHNISLESDVIGLSELVVTALGVEREERSLGYSSQAIDTEGMTESRTTNFINSLSGKIAGAQITNANRM